MLIALATLCKMQSVEECRARGEQVNLRGAQCEQSNRGCCSIQSQEQPFGQLIQYRYKNTALT